MSQSFDTSDAPHITFVRCEGNLTIAGTKLSQIIVEGAEGKIHVERQGESLAITAEADCRVRCPAGASITLKRVSGVLSAQELGGPLVVESADGDVMLRGVGPVALGRVRGDLQVRDIEGDLQVDSVNGSAQIRQVAGRVILKEVRGDLAARELDGGALVERVGGDVSLNVVLASGASYRFEADGDISARVDLGSGARVTLEGDEVYCRLRLRLAERTSKRVVGTAGDGSAELILKAKGSLLVSDRSVGWCGPGAVEWESAMGAWAQQFEEQMAEMQRKMEERLASIPYVDSERVARHMRKAAERARARAERAAHKHERRAHLRWSWSVPQPPPPANEPVSDAERMAILRMVADKKITAEEASRLLAALEGQG